MHLHKLSMIAAGGVGYVLGAKAGRTRYEQIRRGAQKVAANPTVRHATERAEEAVANQAPAVKEKVAAAASHLRPHHDDRAAGVHRETGSAGGTEGIGWPADTQASRPMPG